MAHYLTDARCGSGGFVGLFFERSIEMLTSIVGTLKAGGTYLPLDPEYPSERLAMILAEAKPSVVLCSEQFRHGWRPSV